MTEYFAIVGIWILLTLSYIVIGIGTTRTIARLNEREISLFEIFFWPVVLTIMAVDGKIQ